MKKLKIDDYKKSMYQIPIFDILIKEEVENKDAFLGYKATILGYSITEMIA